MAYVDKSIIDCENDFVVYLTNRGKELLLSSLNDNTCECIFNDFIQQFVDSAENSNNKLTTLRNTSLQFVDALVSVEDYISDNVNDINCPFPLQGETPDDFFDESRCILYEAITKCKFNISRTLLTGNISVWCFEGDQDNFTYLFSFYQIDNNIVYWIAKSIEPNTIKPTNYNINVTGEIVVPFGFELISLTDLQNSCVVVQDNDECLNIGKSKIDELILYQESYFTNFNRFGEPAEILNANSLTNSVFEDGCYTYSYIIESVFFRVNIIAQPKIETLPNISSSLYVYRKPDFTVEILKATCINSESAIGFNFPILNDTGDALVCDLLTYNAKESSVPSQNINVINEKIKIKKFGFFDGDINYLVDSLQNNPDITGNYDNCESSINQCIEIKPNIIFQETGEEETLVDPCVTYGNSLQFMYNRYLEIPNSSSDFNFINRGISTIEFWIKFTPYSFFDTQQKRFFTLSAELTYIFNSIIGNLSNYIYTPSSKFGFVPDETNGFVFGYINSSSRFGLGDLRGLFDIDSFIYGLYEVSSNQRIAKSSAYLIKMPFSQTTGNYIKSNKWHHISLSSEYNNVSGLFNISFFIDGLKLSNQSITPITLSFDPLVLSSENKSFTRSKTPSNLWLNKPSDRTNNAAAIEPSTYYFMDKLRIYNRKLTDAEVLNNYRTTTNYVKDGLQLYYDFNQVPTGNSKMIYDKSGFNRNAEMKGYFKGDEFFPSDI
jgi:hypothetical protein